MLAASPGLVSESPRRIAALVDFSYNLGAGRYRASTLRRRVNEGWMRKGVTMLVIAQEVQR